MFILLKKTLFTKIKILLASEKNNFETLKIFVDLENVQGTSR